MHAARHGTHARHKLRGPSRFPAEGIEYPYFNVLVAVGSSYSQVPPCKVHVINENTYPHAPFSGLDQLICEQEPDEIVMIQVVLDIDTPFSQVCQDRPRCKSVEASGEKHEPGLPRVGLAFIVEGYAQPGIGCIGKGIRQGSINIFG